MRKLLLSLIIVLSLYGCNQIIIPNNPELSDTYYERLFERDVYKSFTIEISDTEFDKLDNYMLSYFAQYGHYKTDEVVLGKLIYNDDLGEISVDNIAFRGRGNTSRVRLKNDDGSLNPSHYKVYFDKPLYMDKESLNYKEIDKRIVFGVSELNFKFNRNKDTSYVSERYSYNLFESFGVMAPKVTNAEVYLKIGSKKTYMGIFSVIESIDKQFLEKRLGDKAGDLYKSLWQQFGPATLESNYPTDAIGIKDESKNYFPSYDLKTNKKTSDHSGLKTFIDMINTLDDHYFEAYINANFAVDDFLRYLAISTLLGNPDDYRSMGNNYYLYQHSKTLKWHFIPYDYDHSLGQGWDGKPVFENYTIGSDIYNWGNLNTYMMGKKMNHPLSDKILKIKVFQEKYEMYLAKLVEENFTFKSYQDMSQSVFLLFIGSAETGLNKTKFTLRGGTYFEEKRADILSQLEYYKNNPNKRP